jgi:hypothetical protein
MQETTYRDGSRRVDYFMLPDDPEQAKAILRAKHESALRDGAVESIAQRPVRPNIDLCPCGSGMRYTRCKRCKAKAQVPA